MKKKSSKGKFRTILIIAILVLVITDLILVVLFKGSSSGVWSVGTGSDENAPSNEQGTNGWYYLYSEETNKKGKLDTDKMKDCVWSTKGSCWFFYEVAGSYMPEEFASEGYDPQKESNWWLFDTEGHMNNAAKTDFSSALAWEAPSRGTYSITVKYEGGTDSYEWDGKTYYHSAKDGGDGLYVSVATDQKVLKREFCRLVTKKDPELSQGEISASVDLEKGDRIYLTVDPGKSSTGDALTHQTTITLEKGGFDLSINNNVALLLLGILAVLIGFVISFISKSQ